jgi:GalNAc5-diNAcBac-PP-undecaprenol beta-1,3-glucosyltransferase
VIEATILIPTHDHATTLPVAIRSALEQRDVPFELFVVGDGVGDDTRTVMGRFEDDPRIRFFDLPKGERRGERNRHVALQDARGEIVCYLSDDDILLPWHVAEMKRLLAHADFVHSTAALADPDGVLVYRPGDLGQREFRALLEEGRNNFVSLTGAAHTRALYERLPYGWRPAPAGVPTDIHMWMQIFALEDVRGATSPLLTSLHFPDPAWSPGPVSERVATLESWLARALRPQGEAELQEELQRAVRRTAEQLKLRNIAQSRALEDASDELERLRAPIRRRVLRKALRYRPVRTLRERLRRSSAVP